MNALGDAGPFGAKGPVARVASMTGADRWADRAASVAKPLGRPGRVRDALSGVPIGHPAHPAVVVVPLGAWVSAALLDATGARHAAAARRLVGAGVLAAVPAMATGLSDWLDTDGAERRVGLLHATATAAATVLQATSWVARRRHRPAGLVASAVAMGAGAIGGWLGGHLAYRAGVGVNTTAFQHGPTTWTDAADASALRRHGLAAVRLGSTALLLTDDVDGVAAIEDRCTHRGGPLHEGELVDGCVSCPWHGSRFDRRDGSVRRGPATAPQPAYEARIAAGRVQVRRDDAGALRRNPGDAEAALPEAPLSDAMA